MMQNCVPGQRPDNDAGYLEMMTAIMFMSGLSRQVVMNKWDGFLAAYEQFDVDKVADFTDTIHNPIKGFRTWTHRVSTPSCWMNGSATNWSKPSGLRTGRA